MDDDISTIEKELRILKISLSRKIDEIKRIIASVQRDTEITAGREPMSSNARSPLIDKTGDHILDRGNNEIHVEDTVTFLTKGRFKSS